MLLVVFFVFLGGFALAQEDVLESGGFELTKLSQKKDFSLAESPKMDFEFKKKQNVFGSFKDFLMSLFVDQYENVNIEAKVMDARGNVKNNIKPVIEYLEDGEFSLRIDNKDNIPLGKYTISLNIQDEEVTGGEIVSFEQDFSWGVLAFNSNKAQLKSGEEAYLQIGVLNDFGTTLCNADVYLEITAPDGGVAYVNTDNGLVINNPECGHNNVIDSPDYYAYYRVGGVGEYSIVIRSVTDNGIYEIRDKIWTLESIPYEIERIGPTRINPAADYSMNIKVTANEDFFGDIIETISDPQFLISPPKADQPSAGNFSISQTSAFSNNLRNLSI